MLGSDCPVAHLVNTPHPIKNHTLNSTEEKEDESKTSSNNLKDIGINELNGKHNRMNEFKRKIKLISNTLSWGTMRYSTKLSLCERILEQMKGTQVTCLDNWGQSLSYRGFEKARELFLAMLGKGKKRARRMQPHWSHKEKILRKQIF